MVRTKKRKRVTTTTASRLAICRLAGGTAGSSRGTFSRRGCSGPGSSGTVAAFGPSIGPYFTREFGCDAMAQVVRDSSSRPTADLGTHLLTSEDVSLGHRFAPSPDALDARS